MDTPTLAQLQSQPVAGDAHLAFQLGATTSALLPMTMAQAVHIVPARRLTPMPNMPAAVLGLINQRSRVLWLVDLAHLLGLPPLDPDLRQYSVIIGQVDHQPLALAVYAVSGVTRITADHIQPTPPAVPPEIAVYLLGCVSQPSQSLPQHLFVLDLGAIVRSPLLLSS